MKMKTKLGFLSLTVLLVAGSAAQAASVMSSPLATQISPVERYYSEGVEDGTAAEAEYAAMYGRGTQQYEDAIDMALVAAGYNARNSSERLYWQGYRAGLRY